METASPAVHTLPAERLALAAPPAPGLRLTCEAPRKLLSLIHPRDSACSLLGTAQGHQAGQHSTATHPQPLQPGAKSQWKIQREALGREAAAVLHTGLVLVLELILMPNYIKEKESCTIVSWRGEGRNRKCTSIFNRKVALENYCVTASITHDQEE